MARLYRGRELVSRQFEEKSKQNGYVYFMRAVPDGLIKIGWSSAHPDARLKRIRATSPTPIAPMAMMKGGLELEAALHGRFLEHWSHGEWFRPDPELLDLISSDGSPWPDPTTNRRPLKAQGANPSLAVSKEEKRLAREEAREEARLVKWAKRITGGCCHDPRILTFFEWSQLYDIPLAMMETWRDEGFRVDLIGYYVKLRECEQQAIPSP